MSRPTLLARSLRRLMGTTLLPGGVLRPAIIEVADGRIAAVEEGPTPTLARAVRRVSGGRVVGDDLVIAPAYIDMHCHGAGGGSAHGDEASLRRMARSLRRHGVGAFVAATMTAPLAELLDVTARVGRVAADRRDDEAVLLGVHLEGPALSPARSAGHDPRSLLPPSSLLASLRADPAAWSTVRVVTMAPELSGGPELIAALAQAGIVASLGHTDASTAEACAAYAAGVRSTTHLFSGMPPLGHRLPGPVGAALAMAPFVELLCDGIHVDAMLLPSLARAIGADRLLLVSDAVPLAGSRRQSMTVAGAKLRIRDGRVVDGEGTLAGSLQLLDGMVASAVLSGIPIAVALRAATQNPADLLGISDRGRIAPGAAADLVLVGRDGGLRGLVPV